MQVQVGKAVHCVIVVGDTHRSLVKRTACSICPNGVWAGLFFLGLLIDLCCLMPVEARSTVAARFASATVHGADHVDELALYMHYFPGDGEAIVRAEFGCEPSAMELVSARAVLGKAVLTSSSGLYIDYADGPLAGDQVDTLYVDLGKVTATDSSSCWSRIYSSLDVQVPAHGSKLHIAIEPSLGLEVFPTSKQIYPGETSIVEIVVVNRDELNRSLRAVDWRWPEGWLMPATAARSEWPAGLAVGDQDTLRWSCRISADAAGNAGLGSAPHSAGLHGGWSESTRLNVAPVIGIRVSVEGSTLIVGERGEFVAEVFNPLDSVMVIEELRLGIPEVLSELELISGSVSAQIAGGTGGGRELVVSGVRHLAPGRTVTMRFAAVPVRSGLCRWAPSFKPVGYEAYVPLVSSPAKIIRALDEKMVIADELLGATDLERVGTLFAQEVAKKMLQLPHGDGRQLYLAPEEAHEGNWLVEAVLHKLIPERGYEITLRDPVGTAAAAAILHYRLVDARVVYSPRSRWLGLVPFGDPRREVFGELILRLENSERKILWVSRAKIYGVDTVIPNVMAVTTSEVVQRIEVAADNKVVELGLTGSIIGGLVYIFFAP